MTSNRKKGGNLPSFSSLLPFFFIILIVVLFKPLKDIFASLASLTGGVKNTLDTLTGNSAATQTVNQVITSSSTPVNGKYENPFPLKFGEMLLALL